MRPHSLLSSWRGRGALVAILLIGSACGESQDATDEEDAAADEAPEGEPNADEPAEEGAEEGGEVDDDQPPKEGGRIVIALPVEPNTLDGARATPDGNNIVENINGNLVGRGQDGGIYPLLAHSWEEADDFLSWTFYLEEGVTFHNGDPFNADAVKYSIERFTDPDFGATSFASYWNMVEEIEVVDDYTVTFHLSEPRSVLAQAIPWHTVLVPPNYIEEVGNDAYGEAPIGTGPFKFKEWVRGQHLILEANADYFLGRPSIDEVEFRFITDEGARAAAVLSGEVDIAGPISIEQLETIEAADDLEIKTADISIRRDRLMLRQDMPPFDDVRMRQAVAYAIDKQAIVDTILQGYGRVTAGPTVEGEFGWRPEIEELDYPYDPDRARELIEEAGYGDGVEIDFDTRPGTFPKDDETPEAIAEYLSAVGIEANIISQDYGTFVDKVSSGQIGEMAMGLMVGGGNFHAFHSFQIFYHCTNSSGIWHPKNDEGNGFYSCYPEMDALADEALVTMSEDEDAAIDLYVDANRYAIENAVSTFLWSYLDPFAVSDRVNWEPTIQGDYLFYEASVNQ